MARLAAWLGGLFSGVVGFFGQYVTKRVAINLAVIAILVSLTGAFYTAITAAIVGISYAMPSEVAIGASWILPSNLTGVLSACLAARVLRFVYDWQYRMTAYKNLIT